MMDRKKPAKSQSLTVEKLRTYPGLEDLNDKEAQEIILTLGQFATICFEIYLKMQRENQEEGDTAKGYSSPTRNRQSSSQSHRHFGKWYA
jgi:hypothetical protein